MSTKRMTKSGATGSLLSWVRPAGFLLLCFLTPAFAAAAPNLSGQWNIQDAAGRERVVLRLTGVDEPLAITRNGTLTVELV